MPFDLKAGLAALLKQADNEDQTPAASSAGNEAAAGSVAPAAAVTAAPASTQTPVPQTAEPAVKADPKLLFTQDQLTAAVDAAVAKALEQSRANAANAQQSAQTFIAANGRQRTADGPWDAVSMLRAEKGDAAVNALSNDQLNAMFRGATIQGFDYKPEGLLAGSGRE